MSIALWFLYLVTLTTYAFIPIGFFRFSEQFAAADYFGEQLLKGGYNYHGNEPMYSGTTGEELQADIYIGVRVVFTLPISLCFLFYWPTNPILNHIQFRSDLPGGLLSAPKAHGLR